MRDLIGIFTGWGGLLSPVLGSPWFVMVTLFLGFGIVFTIGKARRQS